MLFPHEIRKGTCIAFLDGRFTFSIVWERDEYIVLEFPDRFVYGKIMREWLYDKKEFRLQDSTLERAPDSSFTEEQQSYFQKLQPLSYLQWRRRLSRYRADLHADAT